VSSIDIYRNTNPSAPTFSATTVAPDLSQSRDAEVGDIDGDGDLDILVGFVDGIAWYENTAGNGTTPFEEHSLDAGPAYSDVELADLDGNGIVDASDIAEFLARSEQAYTPELDVNADGSVDSGDLVEMLRLQSSVPAQGSDSEMAP